MYHYVREHNTKYPNFRYLDIGNFRKQLDFFKEKFGFLSKQDWDKFTNSGILPENPNQIILTFDDAMSCHFDYVFPELINRNLWGIFYIPTGPYQSGQILDVHKIHLLCGAFDGKELHDLLLQRINQEMIPDTRRKEFHSETYKDKEDTGVAEFKRILNYFISYNYRQNVIDNIAKTLSYEFPKNFYVKQENLKVMADKGMVLGSHTVDHPLMSKLSKTEQAEQIKSSFQFLDEIGCTNIKTYCHPYGGFHSFDKQTIDILHSEEVVYSFNVNSRDINKNDFEQSRQYLPRYDCNEFNFGKTS